MTTTRELVDYYVDLLIMQYHGLPKAGGTIDATAAMIVQPQQSVYVLAFNETPTGGTYTLGYDDEETSALAYNASAGAVQTALRLLTGLSEVTVTGTYTDGFTVTMAGVPGVALALTVDTNTTDAGLSSTETDLTLPLAVEGGFNLIGDNPAVGTQLDVLGMYAGVTRTGRGFSSQITLDDADYLTLIQMAIIKNSAGSSLSEIMGLLFQFFGTDIRLYDTKTMVLQYFLAESVVTNDLLQLFIAQGLLPVPMAVGAVVVLGPGSDYFGFRTYEAAAGSATPFNTYADYNTDWTWLSYSNVVYSTL